MSLTVAEVDEMFGGDRFMRGVFTRRRLARGEGEYGEFVAQLYSDLDAAINGLQKNPELLQEDVEDRITLDILLQLRTLKYGAEQDVKSGGHVDLTVVLGEFTWIGEAKKDGNFDQGFLQLNTRYVAASGDFRHNAAGLLFYLVKSPRAKARMDAWRAELEGRGIPCKNCDHSPLAFYSEHVHEGTGLPIYVRTMIVSLYHRPEDKSGEDTRERRASGAAKAIAVEGMAAPKPS